MATYLPAGRRGSAEYLPAGRQGALDLGSMEEYFAYVLKSEIDGRLYKGYTHDLENRLNEHNSGKVKSTKGYLPWLLVYFETFLSENDAIKREKYFKTGSGREFLKKLLLNKY